MSPVQRRVKTVIDANGESVTVDGSSVSAISVLLSPSQVRTYLSDAAIGTHSSDRPFTALYVPFDVTVATGDAALVGGLGLTVTKVIDLRHRGETVSRLLVCA